MWVGPMITCNVCYRSLMASFVVAPVDIVRTKKLGSVKVDETDLDPSYFGFF
jgi:hypothetical protein